MKRLWYALYCNSELWILWTLHLTVRVHYFPRWYVVKRSCALYVPSTVACCYNAVKYNTMVHTSLHQELRQIINQRLNQQKTPILCPDGRAIGSLSWKVWRKLMAPHCIFPILWQFSSASYVEQMLVWLWFSICESINGKGEESESGWEWYQGDLFACVEALGY